MGERIGYLIAHAYNISQKEGEEYLVANNELGEVYLYKAGHHGSKTSSSMKLLNVIKPKVAVATCVAFTTEYTDIMDNTFPTKTAIDNLISINTVLRLMLQLVLGHCAYPGSSLA